MFRGVLILLLLGSLSGSWALQLDTCSSNSYRLPKSIHPTHYDLTLDVDLSKDTFDGEVDIYVKVETKNELLAQNQIALHASKNMSLEEVKYKELNSDSIIKVVDICRNNNDVVIISLEQELVVGSEGLLHISFVGKYEFDEQGFYKSTEIDEEGNTYEIAVSQYEPIDARRGFPCFDEPAMKATFNISITHDKDQTALSNCEQISQEDVSGSRGKRLKTTFAKTPYMSTYLVAYVVGRFDYIEQDILDGRVKLRMYTPVGRADESRFGLESASKSLPLLEDYFAIDFPLNKIDIVSVREYNAGAMENWGLITMLETMLMDNNENPHYSPVTCAQTIVHELAHQWFGNLVTMEWWNDLWLNEGFANWVEYNMTAVIMPEIDFNAIFIQSSVDNIFKTDFDGKEEAVASKNLIENVSVDTVALIVYDKGSAIIKNLQQEYLHPDNFRDALRHYMKTHAYGNARSEDLWHSMELYSREPVAQFMESWLYQDGHPIITVDVDNGFLTLQQSVFTQDKSHLVDPNKHWIIPVTVLVSDSGSRQEVITVTLTSQEVETVNLPDWYNPKVSSHWLKLNCNATGIYNVEYSKKLLKNLQRPVEKRLMNSLDRLDLITNYAALFNGDYILPIKFSDFVKWFKKETDYTVLKGVLNAVEQYQNQFPDNHVLFMQVFDDFLSNYRYDSKVDKNSFNTEVRSKIVRSAILYRHKPTVKWLSYLLDKSKSMDKIPEPQRSDLLFLVLIIGTPQQKNIMKGMVNRMEPCSFKEYALKRLH